MERTKGLLSLSLFIRKRVFFLKPYPVYFCVYLLTRIVFWPFLAAREHENRSDLIEHVVAPIKSGFC
jgi:hypothetical protein